MSMTSCDYRIVERESRERERESPMTTVFVKLGIRREKLWWVLGPTK